jgi:aspartokinase-like uncharacterized kinase
MSLTLVKVGGSLLSTPQLATGLREWFAYFAAEATAAGHARAAVGVVVGGGPLVDVVRGWDPLHDLSSRTAHNLAISALRVTAELVAGLLNCPLIRLPAPAGPGTHDRGDTDPWLAWPATDREVVFDLAAAAMADPALPASWDVTSDSLALWLARRLHADRLVLLKAVNPLEKSAEMARIQGLDWIDAYFSRMLDEGGHPEIQVDLAHYFHRPRSVVPVQGRFRERRSWEV